MPYTTNVPSTTITAAWGNANVRDQVATPFANAAARDSAITSPVDGMICYLIDVDRYERYKASAGAWRRLDWEDAWGYIDGNYWDGSAAALATGVSTTEVLTNMDTGSLTLTVGRSYDFRVRAYVTASDAAANYWLFQVRRATVSGTALGQHVVPTNTNSFGLPVVFDVPYEPTSTITDTFVLTCQRLAGTATASVGRFASGNPMRFAPADMGPSGRMTKITS